MKYQELQQKQNKTKQIVRVGIRLNAYTLIISEVIGLCRLYGVCSPLASLYRILLKMPAKLCNACPYFPFTDNTPCHQKLWLVMRRWTLIFSFQNHICELLDSGPLTNICNHVKCQWGFVQWKWTFLPKWSAWNSRWCWELNCQH